MTGWAGSSEATRVERVARGSLTTSSGAWCRASRMCRRAGFSESHLVAYTQQTPALCGTVGTLLDAASYGSRWVLLAAAA